MVYLIDRRGVKKPDLARGGVGQSVSLGLLAHGLCTLMDLSYGHFLSYFVIYI